MTTIGYSLTLLFVAVLVALMARRLHVPYSVGLMITGIALALGHVSVGLTLTPELIFDLLLPPLIFGASINIPWAELRRDMIPILTLATSGVIVSALVTMIGTHYFLAWPWGASVVFAFLIAATDPVAVIALFKDVGIEGRVRLLVESESLFNDGTAAVLFALSLSLMQSQHISFAGIAWSVILMIGGAIAAGALVSLVTIYLARRTSDHLVETALTAIAAYGSFILGQSIGASGILATVTAGLCIGNIGLLRAKGGPLTHEGREFTLKFWEFAGFLADSIIFLLLGLHAATVPFASFGWIALLAVIAIIICARALTVYPLAALFSGTTLTIPLRDQHVLWWGGLRGALAIALSLSLPSEFPLHDQIVIATFGVVAFSILVQGLSMPLMLRRLGLMPRKRGVRRQV